MPFAYADADRRRRMIPGRPTAQPLRLATPIRVLLVEDSRVLSERIAEVLTDEPRVRLVDTVDTETKAISAIERRHIDIVVLDLHLKEGTGFGVLRAIGAMHDKPRVIVLTNYDLAEYKHTAIALGATLYLDKARDFSRLPDIIGTMTAAPINRL